MDTNAQQKIRKIRLRTLLYVVSLALLLPVYVFLGLYQTASATDTQVNLSIQSTGPALITLELPPNATRNADGAAVVKSSKVRVQGEVKRISQLTVYIDGGYSSTVSLATGATRYTIDTEIAVGTHEIKLVAIDPNSNNTLEVSMKVIYQISPTTEVVETAKDVIKDANGAIVSTQNIAEGQVTQASGSGPMKTLIDATYAGLVSVDLIPATGRPEVAVGMFAARFITVTSGLLLLTNPWLIYLYLFSKLPFVPHLTVPTASVRVPLRLAGVALLALSFILLV